MEKTHPPVAAVAFLVHLPQNSAWQAVGRKLEVHVGRPFGTTVDAGYVEIAGADSLSGETQETAEKSRDTQDTEQPKRLTRTDSDSDEQQQIVGHD